MRHILRLTTGACLLAGCVTSEDPAEGGFFNGVSGITTGQYDQRIEEREQGVADATTRNEALAAEQARLSAEIQAAESELARLKLRILNQKTAIGGTDARTEARVQAVLNAKPSGGTQADQLAALQKTIADAKALSADLAKLSG